MDVNFTRFRDYLYQAKLNLPYTRTQLIQEFQDQPWEADQAGYGQNNFDTRYRLHNPQGTMLKDIVDYVEHSDFKQRMIAALYSSRFFSGYWGMSPEKMDETTHLYALYTWDRPGYSIRIHTDDRMHVAQGMIYFIDGDDPDQSTTFYTDKHGSDPFRIPTGYGLGFVGANTGETYHSGQNSSSQERYSLMLGLRLKQFHTQ
jgi:hypothetical protein